MTGQEPMRRYRLTAEGPDGDGGKEYQLIDTFNHLAEAVDAIGRLYARGGELAGGAELVILDEQTNKTYNAAGELIDASAAA